MPLSVLLNFTVISAPALALSSVLSTLRVGRKAMSRVCDPASPEPDGCAGVLAAGSGAHGAGPPFKPPPQATARRATAARARTPADMNRTVLTLQPP